MFFTGVFYLNDSVEVLQCMEADPAGALQSMVGRLPYHDSDDYSDSDLDALLALANREVDPELIPVTGRDGVWYWADGDRLTNRILGYVIATVSPPQHGS